VTLRAASSSPGALRASRPFVHSDKEQQTWTTPRHPQGTTTTRHHHDRASTSACSVSLKLPGKQLDTFVHGPRRPSSLCLFRNVLAPASARSSPRWFLSCYRTSTITTIPCNYLVDHTYKVPFLGILLRLLISGPRDHSTFCKSSHAHVSCKHKAT